MEKTKDGRMVDVIGEFTLHSPPIPDRSAFLNGHITKKADQKFVYDDLPTADEYNAWPRYRQQVFEDQQWNRRLNGAWFYNCGVPTYITGNNWFYLNYHRYGVKKPEYRETHRRLFWVWLHCLEAGNCLGLYLHTRRRYGKTSIAASIMLEGATRIPFFRGGIRSKTEDDAEVLFAQEIVNPFQAFQECPWFLPQVSGTNKPKRELLFDTPTNRKKGAGNTPDRVKGLKSKIDWRESVETAYDSQGLTMFINDEAGKKQRFDSFAAHSIVSKQFDPDGYVVGKEWASTTSDENDDASVEKCAEFWHSSDQTRLTGPDSRTESGLWRLMVPDYEGFMVDEYGRDTEQGRQTLDLRRAEVAHDPIKSLRRRRAYPRTIEEALLPSVKADCVVNAEHVGHVLTWLAQQEPTRPVVNRYDLEWVDPQTRTRVRAIQNNTSGRFYFSWIPPDAWLNQVEIVGQVKTSQGLMTKWKPLNTHRFGSGADPADHRDPEKLSGASKTALTAFYKYDEDMEARAGEPGYWPSHSMILEYAERMADPDMYFEDVCKLIHFLGCSHFPETNRPGLANYLKARGYELFLSKRPASTQTEHTRNQKNAGAASSTLMIGRYTEEWVRFVSQYVGSELSKNSKGEVGVTDDGMPFDPRRCPFERSLNNILQFDPNNTTKFDLAVSGGYGLCDINRYQPYRAAALPDDALSLASFDLGRIFK